MPTISGNVFYAPNNTLTPTSGIPNVPVVLRDPTALNGAIALTDANGAFVFTNVPNGMYQLIEAWGTPGGVATPVNYPASLISMPVAPIEAEPPLSAITVTPPPLADLLMAISPNLLNLTVAGDLAAQNFYDAPVGNKPVVFNGLQMVGPNLVTAADNGSFGTVPAGSPVNTIPAVAPYPTATPGLPYQAAPEITDGHYSIVNIRRAVDLLFNWWNLSDHETMLETGRFMFVNGDLPGSVLFTNTISVTPNTLYTFTGWGMNLLNINGTPPRFSIKVIGSDGSTLGYELLNSINYTPIPVWYQAGFLFNSGAFQSITVEVISEALSSLMGNDYVIDELRLFQTNVLNLLQLQKSMVPSTIYSGGSGAGQDVTVTVTVTNTSASNAPNVVFQDTIDPQLQFVPGSVTVNGSGVGYGTADPNVGFSIGNMAPGELNTVMFHVTTVAAGPVVIPNTANASYDAATNGNGDIIRNTVESNTATLEIIINRAIVEVDKKVDKLFAKAGDVLTYTLNLKNTGNMPANNVVITDPTPAGTAFINGTLFGATGTPPTLHVASIPAGGNTTVTYQVLVGNTIPTPNPVPNTASVAFTFTANPAQPDGETGTSVSNTALTQINSAIITTSKSVDKAFANAGDAITYTITVANSGSVPANNVVITDAIPAGTTFVVGSLTGAAGTPPLLTLLSPVPAGGSAVVTYQVRVGSVVPTPNPVKNSASTAFAYTVDPSQPNGVTSVSYGNTVETRVNTAKLVVTKSANKHISSIGDTITYQITVHNTGNVPANNVLLTDLLFTGVSYVAGSLMVSAPYSGTLTSGLTLTNPIAAGQTVTLSFRAKVDAMPNPNPITNRATAAYAFTVDPAAPNGVTATTESNLVNTLVFRYHFAQQISSLIDSVAVEQAALAALANAEGAKIQKMVALGGVTTQELLCLNKSVADMMDSIAMLEAVLKQKLSIVTCQINGGCM